MFELEEYLYFKGHPLQPWKENEYSGKDFSACKELVIFDFDGTLFRSPLVPPYEDVKVWGTLPESLGPPYMPKIPPNDMWNMSVVEALKKSFHDSNQIAFVLTARRAMMADRILDLLSLKSAEPDFFACRRSPLQLDKYPVYFKRSTTARVMDRYPKISSIIVYEDSKEQIASLRQLARRKKAKFKSTLCRR